MSGEEEVQALTSELGKSLPAELAALPAEVLGSLVAVVREAKRQQLENIDKATDEAIGQLPMMLRGPVKRVLKK